MNEHNTPSTSPVEWGVATRAYNGQSRSGDSYVVESFPNGALAAVIDGLGHGERAARASEIATAVLEARAQEPVERLLKHCHQSLRGSRGVVMSLASFAANGHQGTSHAAMMTWLGVGNVKGVLLRANHNGTQPGLSYTRPDRPAGTSNHEWLLLRGGVVGYNLPSLRPITLPIAIGDTLIFVTDGIRSSFAKLLAPNGHLPRTSELVLDPVKSDPQHIANTILNQYGRETDDALVLVARYVGSRQVPNTG